MNLIIYSTLRLSTESKIDSEFLAEFAVQDTRYE